MYNIAYSGSHIINVKQWTGSGTMTMLQHYNWLNTNQVHKKTVQE